MSPRPKPTEQIDASATYNFLYGRFAMGTYTIPYLVLSMRLYDAANELHIAEEVTPVGFDEADLEELYQRQVDWSRVLHQIVPYLKDPNRPQFFNALTVALLPYEDGRFVGFDRGGMKAPSLDDEYDCQLSLGPVSLGIWGDADAGNDPSAIQIGAVRWNRENVRCIAIDGQHRLGALKQLKEEETDSLKNSHITVVMVVPSERLGLVDGTSGYDHVRLMRKLFTDLNQYAVPVSRARQLLLDDYDPQSLCVRRVVSTTLHDASSDWRDEGPTRMPLVFVDWHTNDSKFSDGPYVTTLLVLDQIVGELLGIRPIRDWTDAKEVGSQIKSLKKLGWAPTQLCEDRLKQLKAPDGGPPFSYPDDDLDAIVEAFARRWSHAILYLLSETYAYRELIQERLEHGTATADFVMWFDAYDSWTRSDNDKTQARLSRIKKHLKTLDSPIDPDRTWKKWIESVDTEKSKFAELKGDSLFFKVVFQKACFHALKALAGATRNPDEEPEDELEETYASFLDDLGDEGESTLLWCMDLVGCINALGGHDADFFTVTHRIANKPYDRFWLGTVARADTPETVDFTNAAAKRAGHWLVIAAILWNSLKTKPDLQEVDSESWGSWDDIKGQLLGLLPTHAQSYMKGAADLLYGNKQGRAMRRVVQARDPALDVDGAKAEALRHEHFARRFQHLYILLVQASDSDI